MAEETRTGAPELSLNELLRIRREKLTNLQDAIPSRSPATMLPTTARRSLPPVTSWSAKRCPWPGA